jgi:hypothetical protein
MKNEGQTERKRIINKENIKLQRREKREGRKGERNPTFYYMAG